MSLLLLKAQLLFDNAILKATNTVEPTNTPKENPYLNSATSDALEGENTEIVGGLVGDGLDNLSKAIADGIVDGFCWLAQKTFDLVSPIILWGSKLAIVIFLIMYFCTRDKKNLSSAFKFFIIFIIVCYLRSILL